MIMPIDELATLASVDDDSGSDDPKERRISFKFLAEQIVKRQGEGKDTIIVIVGERRNGKSNFCLKLIDAFIREKDLKYGVHWNWELNWPRTRMDALKNIAKVHPGTFLVHDEGGDTMARSDTAEYKMKMLVKLMSKSGARQLLTIINLPDIELLNKKILNMCLWMVIIPYRYEKVCAFAFIYGKANNAFVGDKFGIERIKRDWEGKKSFMFNTQNFSGKLKLKRDGKDVIVPYDKNLFHYLMKRIPNYLDRIIFGPADKRLEELYIKNVKNFALEAHELEDEFVRRSEYNKLEYTFDTFIYNLYLKAGMSASAMSRFMIDGRGNRLMGDSALRNRLDSISAREYQHRSGLAPPSAQVTAPEASTETEVTESDEPKEASA
jgi:hypothetical protein